MSVSERPLGHPFSSFLGFPTRAALSEAWVPAVDIKQQDGAYHIEMDVPGFVAEDIDVEAHDQVLTVQGERSESSSDDSGDFVHRERRYGKFVRRFNLPGGVDGDAIQAQVKNGVLQVVIPSQRLAAPQKIKVEQKAE